MNPNFNENSNMVQNNHPDEISASNLEKEIEILKNQLADLEIAHQKKQRDLEFTIWKQNQELTRLKLELKKLEL
jgi:hypothetical protein